ncbi:PA0069 family radical SAM protein [Pseudooceanicola sp.]|uniref:PA0069 family radical SAM protein n=1 Tax=Pseudooceanicola sp. TaxID=1914328 RepID=UPI0026092199|nr:PA0069 family radical SAM protein [Pseudooceanicola sp.]MDF1854046.1 PA0069 family radical SAM protein [Pseudooceanicola sp.]
MDKGFQGFRAGQDLAAHRLDDRQRRGRAAASNRAGRFERQERVAESDGWDLEEALPVLRTEVRHERLRRVITYNRAPDLPFDRSINPYRGCEHGCIYCFARPTHAWLGLSAGLDFETRLVARPGAAAGLERELAAPGYRVAPIALGTNTDPYQPLEQREGVTRALLLVLLRSRHPVAIVTKGRLILRDLDLLQEMAELGLVRVGISLTTLDPALSRRMEPRAPAPAKRLQVIRALAEAGIPVRVMTSPIIPGLTDHEVEALLQAAADAGAQAASWVMLRLPLEVAPLFRDWLAEHYPDRAGRVMRRVREMHGGKDYEAKWGLRMRGSGAYAEMIAQRFATCARRLGLDRPQPGLRCDLFRAPEVAARQLPLF